PDKCHSISSFAGRETTGRPADMMRNIEHSCPIRSITVSGRDKKIGAGYAPAPPFSAARDRQAGRMPQGPARDGAGSLGHTARGADRALSAPPRMLDFAPNRRRSEEHTSELQSRENLVCRLLLEKKKWK